MSWYEKTALGQETNYHSDYSPALLCPLLRAEGRQQLGLDNANLPFKVLIFGITTKRLG